MPSVSTGKLGPACGEPHRGLLVAFGWQHYVSDHSPYPEIMDRMVATMGGDDDRNQL